MTPTDSAPFLGSGRNRLLLVGVALVALLTGAAIFLLKPTASAEPLTPEQSVQNEAQEFVRAFNDGDVKKLSDLSCGAFADSFGGVDPAEIARQAAEAREVRGAGEFVDFRGTTVEGDFATFTATLRYEHAPNDPQGLGRPVTVDLQHSDDSWKVFSYKDFGPE